VGYSCKLGPIALGALVLTRVKEGGMEELKGEAIVKRFFASVKVCLSWHLET
jgi:hypothetical protein